MQDTLKLKIGLIWKLGALFNIMVPDFQVVSKIIQHHGAWFPSPLKDFCRLKGLQMPQFFILTLFWTLVFDIFGDTLVVEIFLWILWLLKYGNLCEFGIMFWSKSYKLCSPLPPLQTKYESKQNYGGPLHPTIHYFVRHYDFHH